MPLLSLYWLSSLPLSAVRSCQIAIALRPRLRPNSIASWNSSQSLRDRRWGEFFCFRAARCRSPPGGHLLWPVLPVIAVPIHPALALRFRRPSGRHRRSRDARRSLARSAATTIPAVPARSLVVSFLRSRRCSCRRRLLCLTSESTSPDPFSLAGFG
jgi:hypothetical protein